MTEFRVYRDLGEGISMSDFEDAVENASNVANEMSGEGTEVRFLGSDALTNEDGTVIGTFCAYDAEDEQSVRDHSDRTGLPVTNVFRYGGHADAQA